MKSSTICTMTGEYTRCANQLKWGACFAICRVAEFISQVLITRSQAKVCAEFNCFLECQYTPLSPSCGKDKTFFSIEPRSIRNPNRSRFQIGALRFTQDIGSRSCDSGEPVVGSQYNYKESKRLRNKEVGSLTVVRLAAVKSYSNVDEVLCNRKETRGGGVFFSCHGGQFLERRLKGLAVYTAIRESK